MFPAMIFLGPLLIFVGVVAYQWEQFNRGRKIDLGLEAPGPVGRYQPIDAGVDGIVILDTATGRLWHRSAGDPSAAWREWAPPVSNPTPVPATKPPAWDDFGRPAASASNHPSAASSDRR